MGLPFFFGLIFALDEIQETGKETEAIRDKNQGYIWIA